MKGPETREQNEKRMRADGMAYAAEKGEAFLDTCRSDLEHVVLTYDDEDAKVLMESIRERFWSGEWEKHGRKP